MIKQVVVFVLLLLAIPGYAQDKKPTTLREVVLAELKATHGAEEWFVPANIAVKGLTAEQASWTDGKGNHSVGQLAYHWGFWIGRIFRVLKAGSLNKSGATTMETSNKSITKT